MVSVLVAQRQVVRDWT